METQKGKNLVIEITAISFLLIFIVVCIYVLINLDSVVNHFVEKPIAVSIKEEIISDWAKDCSQPTPEGKAENIDLSSKTGLKMTNSKIYYEIRGTNESEIIYQFKKCGPHLYDAITYSVINNRYSYDDMSDKICNIQDFAVGVNSVILYPKWDNSRNTDQKLNEKWDKYMVALQIHENKHVDIAEKNAKKVYSYLQTLQENKTCLPSAKYLDNKLKELSEQMEADNQEYDYNTMHGQTQGAIFNASPI